MNEKTTEMKGLTVNVHLIEDDEDDSILTRELLSEVKGDKYVLDSVSRLKRILQ